MLLKRTTTNVLIVLTLGAAFGTLLGSIIKVLVPESNVKFILFKNIVFGIESFKLNLIFIRLGLSFHVVFNIFTVFFVFLMIYLLIKH